MRYFVIGDLHFGEESFYRFSEKFGNCMRPEFKSAEEADAAIIDLYNTVVPAYDSTVYFLGDLARNSTNLQKLDLMHGQHKVLVAGNHDLKFPLERLRQYFDKIAGCAYILNKAVLLTHIPVHPVELRGSVNVHGHVHRNSIIDLGYKNACLEVNNYAPLELFFSVDKKLCIE